MIRSLFFDIDGTLVSFRTHRIPQATVDALTEAKARGVKVFISTGRPIQFITNLSQIEHLIDGYITTNGAYCFVGDDTVSRHAIDPADVKKILDACDRFDRAAVVVGQKTIAVYNCQPIVAKSFGEGLGLTNIDFDELSNVLRQDILQVTPFITDEEEAQLMPTIPHCVGGRWTKEFVDITQKNADKGKGLIAMAAHEHFGIDETMAFGDGGNDIPIIRQAGIGVAMGNATDNVKDVADYITTAVDDEGVKNALIHFGVIKG